MLVEALVLDRDHRLLHHGGDLVRLDQDPALVVGERGELLAVGVVDDRVLGARSYCARFSSWGRSWATAIMIPKIQETNASAVRPRTTKAKRSLRSRGRVRVLGARARRLGEHRAPAAAQAAASGLAAVVVRGVVFGSGVHVEELVRGDWRQ